MFENERQVTTKRMKVMDIPAAYENEEERWSRVLFWFGRAYLEKTVLPPQTEREKERG